MQVPSFSITSQIHTPFFLHISSFLHKQNNQSRDFSDVSPLFPPCLYKNLPTSNMYILLVTYSNNRKQIVLSLLFLLTFLK